MDWDSKLDLNELKNKLKKHHFFPYAPPDEMCYLHRVVGVDPLEIEGDGNTSSSPKSSDEGDGNTSSSTNGSDEDDLNIGGLTFKLSSLFSEDKSLGSFRAPQPIEERDVISLIKSRSRYLVRNGGERVKAEKVLKDKYVLVFCFSVPSIWCDMDAMHIWGMSALCAELAAKKRNEVEMVMVAKMKPEWQDDEEAFDQFFSAFPDCLAVPFKNKQGRDYLYKAFYSENRLAAAVFVDRGGKVLQKDLEFLYWFGADSFPFVGKGRSAIVKKEQKRFLKGGPGAIERLLGCSVLRHIDTREKREKDVALSDIEKNPVGLYLCCTGIILQTLGRLYQQCTDKGLPFEIVLICCPFEWRCGLARGSMFQKLAERGLKKLNVSFYVLPPQHLDDNSTLRRVWRICGSPCHDRLVVVTPDDGSGSGSGRGRSVELNGEEVFYSLGIKGYPFSLVSVIEREVARLRKLDLKSFVMSDFLYRYTHEGEIVKVPVASLEGRNIFLYYDSSMGYYGEQQLVEYRDDLRWWHSEMTRKYRGSQGIFVYWNPGKPNACAYHEFLAPQIPWLVCPSYGHSANVAQNVGEFLEQCALVGFGKDGKICSLRFGLREAFLETDADPFKETLQEDVVNRIRMKHLGLVTVRK